MQDFPPGPATHYVAFSKIGMVRAKHQTSCDLYFKLKIAVIEVCLAPLKYSGLAAFRRDSTWAVKEL